jgi:flavin reductase (DIM6/NTAB) family NADH-FMN oxidoreductase RutF
MNALYRSRRLHSSVGACYKDSVIPPDDFRRVLGHFAAGVTVVTTTDGEGRPTGLTATAFTSVSLDPPLILICVSQKSQSYPALLERRQFAVNFLRLEQEDISRRFATTRLDKFDGVAYRMSALTLPILTEALAHVECVTVNQHIEGDHTILIGRVEACETAPGEPLLYFRGQYTRLSGA